ncbi:MULTISPECIES: NAD(P)/FAD-dependent oxidoreductase [unclassified Mycolicibacterium]|uniref:FAD-dependent oxidoreductase n=1 Tax=unclassified Mycolicibacterium TaxID=2636767 RepID=UPI0012DF9799|nr:MULTISPECIES: 2-polyprenyl-6-methoxyphenol hydroxylase-like oxidoreductase [unclassified Mycolicibacterium]MUL85550.1 2-polyprenyl-6-methoxyphenol hydroxylase-like oxidoreductase [Mycolicibacterium sp. CBMA 329]MUL88686.1 2-polyprenyl-6-methoxyphenol hydroxylase-like oxidoreductase [Mycolicibacterium sp. CBMA 331]MUM02019.1 2-polyprenyl-6-methoxyphenol hydroxylase-like oxidoreductase [Mycolicibacterium sp. CBMA 334]MUM26924.1 2-polyprenyl-6-methoxyphenol hydroxylase-like oxidoreductase [Myco
MATIGKHAVVLGASMGGLLAARALAEFFDTVTLVERDVLPDGPVQRRGVPQGRHAHGLLSGGLRALAELFPGLPEELAADGATVLEGTSLSDISLTFGGHTLNRGQLTQPIESYLASRPFLEGHIRDRVRAIENISILDGHDAVELLMTDARRVTGVLVADRSDSAGRAITADLIVDAMGRAGRTPAFLDSAGFGRPAEDRIEVQVAYSSQLLRFGDNAPHERLTLVGAVPERPCGASLFAYEDNTWLLTTAGMTGQEPPADLAGMIGFIEEFMAPGMVAALRSAQPLGPVAKFRYPASVRRRYERMTRFPDGLLVFGDAICSFNPVYGQGMSVAALEALALRDCLARGADDLGRRFLRAAADVVNTAWQMASGADLALPQIPGPRPVSVRLSNWYTERVLTAAEGDPLVTEAFYRVMNLVDPPRRLLHPSIAARVAVGASRRRRDTRPAAAEPTLAALR